MLQIQGGTWEALHHGTMEWGKKGRGYELAYLWVVQALPEGEAGAVVALRVDVGQDGHEEGGGLLLGDQLPAAGLTELQAGDKHRDGVGWPGVIHCWLG